MLGKDEKWKDMKIGILYICTGNYNSFWEDFYKSAEKYFLPGEEKYYFVFTDAERIYAEESLRVTRISEYIKGWPDGTMFRFRIFKHYLHLYRECDYLYFFNANVLFLQKVGMEATPMDRLVVYQHFGFYEHTEWSLPYERNPRSQAGIPWGSGKHYVMGGFNGGPIEAYTQLIKDLDKATDADYNNGILPYSFDESQLNRYVINHSYKMLPWHYVWPEEWDLPKGQIKPHIMLRDKRRVNNAVITKAKSGLSNRIKYWHSHPDYFRAYMKHGRFLSGSFYYIVRRSNNLRFRIWKLFH